MSKFQAKRKKGGEEQRVIVYANILPFLSGNPTLYKECCPVNFHFDLIDQENEGQPKVCAIASLGGTEFPVTARSAKRALYTLGRISESF